MPRVTIDTTEALSFEATEPGPYPMTISKIDFKKSKESKEPMMEVYYSFEDPERAKRCGNVIRNYMLAGKGAGFTRDFLKVFGIDVPIGTNMDFDSDDILGQHVVVEVGNQEYLGKLGNTAERVVLA